MRVCGLVIKAVTLNDRTFGVSYLIPSVELLLSTQPKTVPSNGWGLTRYQIDMSIMGDGGVIVPLATYILEIGRNSVPVSP